MVPFFFQGLDINTYTNFQKILHATNGPRNHSLQLATSGCYCNERLLLQRVVANYNEIVEKKRVVANYKDFFA